MPDRAPHFRQRDIERAIKAARKAGETGVVRVRVDAGKVTVIAYPPGQEPAGEGNPWDDED